GVERPAHRQNDFMIFEEIGELAAGGPYLSNVGLQLDQLFLDRCELFIRQAIKLRGIRLVVAEDLRGHIDGGEVIPNGNLSLVLGIPKNGPGIRRLGKDSRIVQKWIWPPHERYAIDLAVGFDERQVAEFR